MGLKHAYLSHAIFPFQLAGRSAPVPYFPSQLFPSNFPSHLPLPASSLSPILILSFQILSTLPKRLLRRVYGILSVSSKFSWNATTYLGLQLSGAQSLPQWHKLIGIRCDAFDIWTAGGSLRNGCE